MDTEDNDNFLLFQMLAYLLHFLCDLAFQFLFEF